MTHGRPQHLRRDDQPTADNINRVRLTPRSPVVEHGRHDQQVDEQSSWNGYENRRPASPRPAESARFIELIAAITPLNTIAVANEIPARPQLR